MDDKDDNSLIARAILPCSCLKSTLLKLDCASYKAYKDIKGRYQFADFTLIVDYVQGDPFASPSQLRIIVPQIVAQFPAHLYMSVSREVALRDYLARQFAQEAKRKSCDRGSGKSGLIAIAPLSQEVLERNSVYINDQELEIRFVVGLPAKGRRILGRQAVQMLCQDLPELISNLLYKSLNTVDIQQQVETVEDADWLRQQLSQHNLVAFIANGAILPRRSGIDPRPLINAVAFQSSPCLEVELDCPNQGKIKGMSIPQGISLIVGGGYHGKSTLLKAIKSGCYNHLPGDGREYIVSNLCSAKIRAEEGRSITGVNISPFINHLPQSRSTIDFATANASGSTSQAANIIEALEAGAKLLLLDEDTSATNFIIRDRRMQTLISKDKEPITPFINKVRQLYLDYGVSTIMVMGGGGDYFEVADRVIALDNYLVTDVTAKAKAIAREFTQGRNPEGGSSFGKLTSRIPLLKSIELSQGKREINLKTRDKDFLTLGTETIDLAAVEQIIDPGQLKAISRAIAYLKVNYQHQQLTVAQLLAQIKKDIAQSGLDILSNFPQGDLVQFRDLELAAALNRLRSLQINNQNQANADIKL